MLILGVDKIFKCPSKAHQRKIYMDTSVKKEVKHTKKDTVASVSVNCQKLAAHWEKAREIMGKEEDNVSHVTELHVLHC